MSGPAKAIQSEHLQSLRLYHKRVHDARHGLIIRFSLSLRCPWMLKLQCVTTAQVTTSASSNVVWVWVDARLFARDCKGYSDDCKEARTVMVNLDSREPWAAAKQLTGSM